jgi:mRNA interferase MazF
VVRTAGDRAQAGLGAFARRCDPEAWAHVDRPCTTTVRNLASEVVVEPGEDPVPRRSAINLDSVESVSVAVLVERVGQLSDNRMREVCAALAVAVDCRD